MRETGKTKEQLIQELTLCHRRIKELESQMGKACAIRTQEDEGNFAERENKKDVLDETNQSLQTLIKDSPLAFVAFDQNRNVTMWNPAAEAIFGRSNREVMGTPVHLVPEDNREEYTNLYNSVFGGKTLRDIELNGMAKDGSAIHMKLWMAPIYNAREEISGVISIIADITEVKKLEQQFLHAQKMESVGRLAGGIAHDINNYLSAISGYSELLRMKFERDPETLNTVDSIIDIVFKAAALVEQLLAFSKKQPIKPKILNLNRVVKRMEKMMERLIGEDITLKTQLMENLWNVKIDRSQPEQIIVNLLVNARDAMPRRGTITLTTENISADSGSVSLPGRLEPRDYVVLSVSDSGVGIPENLLDKIFEPFFTTKEKSKGSGLGLSTIYGIVKQNGGDILVESSSGNGTTFKIYLPRCDEQFSKTTRITTSSISSIETFKKILFVEDNSDVREATKAFLEEMGYEVYTGKDGEEALQLFENQGGDIDIVITDVMMPGINGKELAKEIQKRKPDVKILFISGYSNNILTEYTSMDDDTHFLQKPFLSKDLAKKIKQIGS